ncbi:ATP-binding domain-containing protein [Phaeobacter sp. C3_T13_0]|uniref:ATP-binding domain-containing protein n=1 Tax=Phaeobacter cretensis TaxID=3342641 RepID=UPI0039BC3E6D
MGATWWTNPSELDAEQKQVVALPVDGHHLVMGPPGCGKTNLLLLRASFLHKKGLKKIAVLTFARTLREFLASGADHYSFSSDKIQTYVRWGMVLLAENGVHLEESEDFAARRASLLKALLNLADKNLPENLFDCILLDEAQDYTSDEIAVLRRFTPRLFAVGDSKQRIQSEEDEVLDGLIAEGITLSTLSFHYRNGLKICRVADGIQGQVDSEDGLEARSNYDEDAYPSTVKAISGASLDNQVEAAIEEIKTQLQAYPDEYIGVLCPRAQELSEVSQALLQSEIAEHIHVQHGDYEPQTLDRRVIVTTIHGAKGLEFRAGHVLGTDLVKNFRLQRKMSYTAVTRCKTSLSVYHNRDLPGYFESGIQACGAPPKEPTIDDLFG